MASRSITFVYDDIEKKVNKFDNFEECKKAFQQLFNISDEDMKNVSLFYIDEEDEQCLMNSNEDYNMFLESEFSKIEGQLQSQEEKPDPLRSGTIFKKKIEEEQPDPLRSGSVFKRKGEEEQPDPMRSGSVFKRKGEDEQPDPMRSGTVFKRKGEEPIKDNISLNLNDSHSLENSLSLENSANLGKYIGKISSNEFGNKADQVAQMMERTAEVAKKDEEIAELQKKLKELTLQHQEEMKKKEEEN